MYIKYFINIKDVDSSLEDNELYDKCFSIRIFLDCQFYQLKRLLFLGKYTSLLFVYKYITAINKY